jgi:hypothetical protein
MRIPVCAREARCGNIPAIVVDPANFFTELSQKHPPGKLKCPNQPVSGVSFRAQSINRIDPASGAGLAASKLPARPRPGKTVVPSTVDVLLSCMPEFPAARMCVTPSAPINPIVEPRIKAQALAR